MNYAEKIAMLKTMQEETNETVLFTYLYLAGAEICTRAFGTTDGKSVPPQYEFLQLEIAAYKLNKRGAEGQISHSENGVSRGYENASTPESMLSVITPYAEVHG